MKKNTTQKEKTAPFRLFSQFDFHCPDTGGLIRHFLFAYSIIPNKGAENAYAA
jgi:hypothetical protein